MIYTRTFIARLAVTVSEKTEGVKTQAKNIAVAVPAGLIATAVMTVVMLMAPLAGVPAINMPRVLGWSVGVPLAAGVVLNFVLGVLLALLFAVFLTRRFAAHAWMNGALFGVAIWAFLMIIGGPLIGWGVFASRTASPLDTILTSFLGHLAFGWTLGFVYQKIVLRVQSINTANDARGDAERDSSVG